MPGRENMFKSSGRTKTVAQRVAWKAMQTQSIRPIQKSLKLSIHGKAKMIHSKRPNNVKVF